MADNTDLLNQIRQVVREENEPLKSEIKAIRQEHGAKLDEQAKDIRSLKQGLETVQLQVEVINANQQRAEKQSQIDHTEIMEHLIAVSDYMGTEQRAIKKRVERIEKHLNLPPVK
jgi:hypothetical protein